MSFAASGLSKRFVVAEEKKGCVMTKLGALPILVPVLILALAFLAHAQQPEIVAGGESEYQRACVVCHGIDGRGDGIMRQYLKIPPANLRQLAKNNGGKFPFWEVYAKIDGQREVRGHGTREMPIWGERFRAGPGSDAKSALTQVAGRILTLTYYLQHIQD
jgi:mono/diheme cytochrome c family protein